MALSITPTPVTASFSDFTFNFILRSESLVRRIYSDGRGVPTLGVGYALAIEVGGIWQLRGTLIADLASVGITLTDPDRQRLQDVVDTLNDATLMPAQRIAAAQALIPVYRSTENSATANVFPNVPLISDTDGRTLFNAVIGEYVQTVRQRLGITPGSAFDTSLEMTALVCRPRNNWTTHFVAFLRRGSVQPG